MLLNRIYQTKLQNHLPNKKKEVNHSEQQQQQQQQQISQKQSKVSKTNSSEALGSGINRADPTVLFRAGRLSRRIQKELWKKAKSSLANSNLQIQTSTQQIPRIVQSLVTFSAQSLDNAAKASLYLVSHPTELSRQATNLGKMGVLQIQSLTASATRNLGEAYSILRTHDASALPMELLIKGQLALKEFANKEIQIVASFSQTLVPKLNALLNSIERLAPNSVAHALHEIIETIRKSLQKVNFQNNEEKK